jgi:hypothetical protein
MGPFTLGQTLFKALAVLAVLGTLLLIWIGIQPPNGKALFVTLATTALLVIGWWPLGIRRIFPGPPVTLAASQTSPTLATERSERDNLKSTFAKQDSP